MGAAVVVVVVVVVVVPEQMLLVQTGSPALLQTQVLQSTLNTEPGVQLPDVLPPAPGHELGQNPKEPSM